jgi:hypothetical protein
LAGLRFKAVVDGKDILLEGLDPVVTDAVQGKLHIHWPLKSAKAALVIDMTEGEMKIKVEGGQSLNWYLDLTTDAKANLPFKKINPQQVNCQFDGMNYSVVTTKGSFSTPAGTVFRVTPGEGQIILDFTKQAQ